MCVNNCLSTRAKMSPNKRSAKKAKLGKTVQDSDIYTWLAFIYIYIYNYITLMYSITNIIYHNIILLYITYIIFHHLILYYTIFYYVYIYIYYIILICKYVDWHRSASSHPTWIFVPLGLPTAPQITVWRAPGWSWRPHALVDDALGDVKNL